MNAVETKGEEKPAAYVTEAEFEHFMQIYEEFKVILKERESVW